MRGREEWGKLLNSFGFGVALALSTMGEAFTDWWQNDGKVWYVKNPQGNPLGR
jgi:hypothetical protein